MDIKTLMETVETYDGKDCYIIKANVELIDEIQQPPNFFVLGPKVSFIKNMLKNWGKEDRLIVKINKDTNDKKDLFDYLSTLKYETYEYQGYDYVITRSKYMVSSFIVSCRLGLKLKEED